MFHQNRGGILAGIWLIRRPFSVVASPLRPDRSPPDAPPTPHPAHSARCLSPAIQTELPVNTAKKTQNKHINSLPFYSGNWRQQQQLNINNAIKRIEFKNQMDVTGLFQKDWLLLINNWKCDEMWIVDPQWIGIHARRKLMINNVSGPTMSVSCSSIVNLTPVKLELGGYRP